MAHDNLVLAAIEATPRDAKAKLESATRLREYLERRKRLGFDISRDWLKRAREAEAELAKRADQYQPYSGSRVR